MELELLRQQCPKLADISGNRVLIFGGSGSLGTTVIKRWIDQNEIMNVSRNEEKQWKLQQTLNNHPHLHQLIGDITRLEDVKFVLRRFNPTIVCVFACMKHIDKCEQATSKAIDTNTNGIMHIYNALLEWTNHPVKTVLFVSTDKACLPITTYGCTKALAEFFIQGIPETTPRWVAVRYGNVLNSSGSILPYLRSQQTSTGSYSLTHPDMTRFIMTLDQSVNLVEYAILFGYHNEIIVPLIKAMRIRDLFNIVSNRFNKTYQITGLRCKEKIHEDLLSPAESLCALEKNGYIHIRNKSTTIEHPLTPFDSSMVLVERSILETYLDELNYITGTC
jgi:UDP-N-acetylglucosamine 4,6-dehydratase